MNNDLSSQIIEHLKKATTYAVGNPGPDFTNGITTPPSW